MRDTENETRRRVREGDREAFAQLYEDHARAVYNHGLRLTGDWSTAEEVMSETFLAAWRTRERVHEEGGSLLPWLLGIATHKAENARRGLRRRQLFLARQPRPRVEEDFAPATVGRLDDARRLRAVHTALSRLRRQECEVLALCVWSGLGYRETADALGIAVGTVRSRLSRARRRLARLTEDGPGREPGRGRERGPGQGQTQGRPGEPAGPAGPAGPAEEPMTGPAEEPMTGPVRGPAERSTHEPADRPADEPADGSAGPAKRPTAGPAARPAAGPAKRPAAELAAGPAKRPAAELAAGPVKRPAAGPATGPVKRPAPGPEPRDGRGERTGAAAIAALTVREEPT